MTTRGWLIASLAAFLAGWWIGSAGTTPADPSASSRPLPEQRLAPESLVLKRQPGPAPRKLPAVPEGATVARAAWVDLEPLESLKPMRIHVLELDTPQGKRIQVTTEGGKVVDGADHPMHVPNLSRWGVSAGAILNGTGMHPAAGVSYTRGKFTFGALAGVRSGQDWPGVVIYANFRF